MKILEQDLVRDKSVLILVETLEPPIIANFLLVEFLISLIAEISFEKFSFIQQHLLGQYVLQR